MMSLGAALLAGCGGGATSPGSGGSSGETGGGGTAMSSGSTGDTGSGGETAAGGTAGSTGGGGGTLSTGGASSQGGSGGSGGSGGGGGSGGSSGVLADWVKVFPYALGPEVTRIATDAIGNVYVAGSVDPGDSSFGDGFVQCNNQWDCGMLLKLDPDGNLLWARVLDAGGGLRTTVRSISVTEDGLLAAIHWHRGGLNQLPWDMGAGVMDPGGGSVMVIARLDPEDGHTLWSKPFGDTPTSEVYVEPDDVVSDGPDAYTVFGSFNTPTLDLGAGPMATLGAFDDPMFVAHFEGGAPVWQHALNGSAGGQGRRVHRTLDGGYTLSGQFIGDMLGASFVPPTTLGTAGFLAHYDAAGQPVWGRTYNNNTGHTQRGSVRDSTGALWLALRGNGPVQTGGPALTLPGNGSYVLKVDDAGSTVYAAYEDVATFDDTPSLDVAVDSADNLFWSARRPTNPGGVLQVTGRLSKLSPEGAPLWEVIADNFGPIVLTCDPADSALVAGKYIHTLDIGVDGPSFAANGESLFVAKFPP